MRTFGFGLVMLGLTACVFGEEYREEAFEFDEEVTRLVIDSEGGNIEISFVEQPSVLVNMTYRYERDEPEVLWVYEDGALEASINCAVLDGRCAADIQLTAPAVDSLVLYAYRGDVTVSNLTGTLSADVRYGNVTADGQIGEADVFVSEGDVAVDGLVGETALLETGAGSLGFSHTSELEFLRANVSGGDLSGSVLPGRYDLAIGEVTGDIVIDPLIVPDVASQMRVELSNTTGNVSLLAN